MSAQAEAVVEGIYFANGLAFDNAQEHLYVAELKLDRVLRYRVGVDAGTVSDRMVYATVLTPDNLAMDADDNPWVAWPLTNSVLVVDGQCGGLPTVFRAASEGNARGSAERVRRSHLGEGRLEPFVPELWDPLPGAVPRRMNVAPPIHPTAAKEGKNNKLYTTDAAGCRTAREGQPKLSHED